MKPITLHPASVLAGLVLAGALFVLAGAAQSHGTVQGIPSHDVRLVGEIPAEWWTYALLRTAPDGTVLNDFAIPSGRYFVVTSGNTGYGVRAGGQDVSTELSGLNNGTRVVLPPGVLVTTDNYLGQAGYAQLWGYLEPVR